MLLLTYYSLTTHLLLQLLLFITFLLRVGTLTTHCRCCRRSAHTLPVTAVLCGAGSCCALVLSTSLDHSCKLHRMSDGALLRTVVLPISLHSLAMDAGEHCLYVGGEGGEVGV